MSLYSDYDFVSRARSGKFIDAPNEVAIANRFRGSLIEDLPIPLPRYYVQGIDYVRCELEYGMPSYLAGEWKHGGWWYYYLYAIAVKAPVGAWILFGVAVLLTCRGVIRWRPEIILLATPVALFVFVSSQTGFNHHIRYLLPAFPFVFVWIGKVGDGVARGYKGTFTLAVLGITVFIAESMAIYPHSHSFFNVLAGGPRNANHHLHSSNVDWGEDLTYLKAWVDARPEIQAIGVAAFNFVNPKYVGIPAFEPNRWPPPEREAAYDEGDVGPEPGWYAISVNHLVGEPDMLTSRYGRTDYDLRSDPSRSYFRYFEPVDRIGYSMNIYHVTLVECNRVRRKLGLKDLPNDWRRVRFGEE